MVSVLDKVEARGIAKGEAKGMVKVYYNDMNLSPEEIAERTGKTTAEVNKILKEIKSEKSA